MKQDSIQDLRAFDERIFETIQEYINNKNSYPVDAVLAISNETKEIIIDSPEKLANNIDKYELSSLIFTNEEGQQEPDNDETFEIASKYYFVR